MSSDISDWPPCSHLSMGRDTPFITPDGPFVHGEAVISLEILQEDTDPPSLREWGIPEGNGRPGKCGARDKKGTDIQDQGQDLRYKGRNTRPEVPPILVSYSG